MSTTTKKPRTGRKPAAGRGKGNGRIPVPGDLLTGEALAGAAAVKSGLRAEGRDIPLAAIVPSPFNPRSEYPAEEIKALAETIHADGLLQPILVRRVRAGFELVAGERRYRACKLLGIKEIPCIIRELDDIEALRLQWHENEQRKDLTIVEKGKVFRTMIKAGVASGPTELARDVLHVSQGYVSNAMRLLELPQKWIDRIASGMLPGTHALALVKYKDHPEILNKVERTALCKDGDFGSVARFEESVNYAVRSVAESMSGCRWDSRAMIDVPIFRPTPDEEQRLRIVEIDGYGGKTERWALNRKLWSKLHAKHAKEFIAKQARSKRGNGKAKAAAKKKPDKPPTAAQRKAEEAAERARQVEHAKQFRKRLYEWKVDWLRYLLAREIGREDRGIDPESLLRLLLYFATSPAAARIGAGLQSRSQDLLRICSDRQIKMRGGGYDLDVWSGIGELTSRVDEAATQWLARQFWSPKAKDGPRRGVPAADVEAIAEFLCIAPEKAWKAEQAGPLSEGFWRNLHTKDQLLELGKESGLVLDKSATKAGMVKAFLHPKKPLPMPKEIGRVKRPRR